MLGLRPFLRSLIVWQYAQPMLARVRTRIDTRLDGEAQRSKISAVPAFEAKMLFGRTRSLSRQRTCRQACKRRAVCGKHEVLRYVVRA